MLQHDLDQVDLERQRRLIDDGAGCGDAGPSAADLGDFGDRVGDEAYWNYGAVLTDHGRSLAWFTP